MKLTIVVIVCGGDARGDAAGKGVAVWRREHNEEPAEYVPDLF